MLKCDFNFCVNVATTCGCLGTYETKKNSGLPDGSAAPEESDNESEDTGSNEAPSCDIYYIFYWAVASWWQSKVYDFSDISYLLVNFDPYSDR